MLFPLGKRLVSMIHIVKEQTVIDSHKPDIVMDEAGL